MPPLEVYVDSDWGVKFSCSGALFYFAGCLVAWFAKVQRSVSFSSAESEMFGAILAVKDGIFYRDLLLDLGERSSFIALSCTLSSHASSTLIEHQQWAIRSFSFSLK